MHDMVSMAVVDAGKNLLDEDSSIILTELSSFYDFIEELTTLADVCDNVVSLLIFEELVHFEDVWMIQIFQNIILRNEMKNENII